MSTDKIILSGLSYDCRIGFHDYEQGVSQRLVLTVEAVVKPLAAGESDRPESLRLDYYKANGLIGEILAVRRYNLIESVAEDVARAILENYQAESVRVAVTKRPHDMPNVESVTYVCERARA